MQINTNYSVGLLPKLAYTKSAAPQQSPGPDTTFSAKEALDAGLQQAPEVRADVVERAARLIQSNNYPSAEQMKQLSNLLAEKLQAPE